MKSLFVVGLAAALLTGAAPVAAQGMPVFDVYTGIGIASLNGREYVYDGAGSTDKLSVLLWDSNTPILTTGFLVTLPSNWVFGVDAQFGKGGSSNMVDFDWLDPFRTSFAADQWTDRSLHPDTALLWYFNGSAFVGYNVVNTEMATITLNTGVRYIDVKWDATGGSANYSTAAFRDTFLNFPPGSPGISYRQQIPSAFIGIDAEFQHNRWTFGAGAKGGITFNATDDDIHWARDLRFLGTGRPAAIISLLGETAFAVTDKVSLFVAGTFDHMSDTRADTRMVTNSTNAPAGDSPDAAGFGFTGFSLTGGVEGHF